MAAPSEPVPCQVLFLAFVARPTFLPDRQLKINPFEFRLGWYMVYQDSVANPFPIVFARLLCLINKPSVLADVRHIQPLSDIVRHRSTPIALAINSAAV